LTRLDANDPEWDAFLQEITTHESYLFRDESQWDWFRGEFLAQRVAEARLAAEAPSLRIWSAACSTGDEAMTAACCVAACISNLAEWKVHILGTDIAVGALAQARCGIFGARAMRLVPESYRRRFFSPLDGSARWRANGLARGLITYRRHNLMQPLRVPPFDLILLKNVLIYFDAASKRRVVGLVASRLRPGGYLVTGAAEGVTECARDLERLEAWLWRRPLHGGGDR
jgi:chemotaxis protein methyltransferase CheR